MSLSNDSIKKKDFLKDKKILLAHWGCEDKDTYQCRDWIPLFEKMFGKLIIFPFRNYYYFYGKRKLNAKFLETIKKEKPDYLLFGHRYNEIEIDTLKKIKEISPKTKTIIEHGDDDFRFDDWGRYYALFFDYVITGIKKTDVYKEDKINDVFFIASINPDFYKSLNLEKKYDVTFIGRPYTDRYDYIKFLKEHGVNIKVFGGEWSKHPDLKDVYEGVLHDEDLVKVINQSKINLNFSKTFYEKGKQGQFKGRVLEVPACGSFLLNEYTDMNLKFISNKKEINFRDKEELLEKIKYYLKHEDERERIAKELRRYIIKHHSAELLFTNFFRRLEKDKSKKFGLPEINKKIAKISYKELDKSSTEIKKVLNDADYVFFDKDDFQSLSNRNYLQAYSLSISRKQISCCDYYVHSRLLGDYLTFKSKNAFNTLGNEFYRFLNINQLMITKEYFLKNLDFFKQLYYGKINLTPQGIIKDEDIVFVSIPLIRIKNLPKTKYEQIKENFYTLFFDKLFSLVYQKKFFNPYIFKFFLFSLMGNFFMIKYLLYRFSFNFNRNILRSFGLVK